MQLAGIAEVRFTDRRDGDLGRTNDDAPLSDVLANRRRVLARCGVAGVSLVEQVHGARVAVVERAPRGYGQSGQTADGQATTLRGVALAVHVADCLPVAIAGEGGVAILHGGWRGLAAGIIEAGVRALREELGVSGPLAGLVGPGAGGCCYEAGSEVHAALETDGASRDGKIDLKLVARHRLERAGVAEIHDLGVCTICGPDLFSHRRGDGGRQAGIAWLT